MPSQSGHQTDLDAKFFGLMNAHEKLISQMRSLIVPKQPLDAGAFLDEWQSASISPLIFVPQIDRPALVMFLMYSYAPTNVAATLTIGQASGVTRTIPIPANNVTMPESLPVAMIIKPNDTITLASAGATALFVEIMGKILSGTDWSQV